MQLERWLRAAKTVVLGGSLSALPLGFYWLSIAFIEEPTEYFPNGEIDLPWAYFMLYFFGSPTGILGFVVAAFAAILDGRPERPLAGPSLRLSNFVIAAFSATLGGILFGYYAVHAGVNGQDTYLYYDGDCLNLSRTTVLFHDYAVFIGLLVLFHVYLGLSLFRVRESVTRRPISHVGAASLIALPLLVWAADKILPLLLSQPVCHASNAG